MRQKVADEILQKVTDDYNQIASEFSGTRNFPWYEFELYRELLLPNDKVLDVGCGNGRLYEALKIMDIDYTGIDISEELLKFANEKFKDDIASKNVKFKIGGFLNMPFSKPEFDKIFCVASFHHLPGKKYRQEALENLKQVLSKDGVLIISVWNLWQKKYRKHIWKSLCNLHKYDFGDTFIPWGNTGVDRYYHAFNVFEMRGLLRESGFFILDEVWMKKDIITENFWEANNLIFIVKPTLDV